MATVTFNDESLGAFCQYVYNVTGLVGGANTITLPTPPAVGSFPPAADWTPTNVMCFPYMTSAIGALCTPDLNTITNSSGVITFTLYCSDVTNCLIAVF